MTEEVPRVGGDRAETKLNTMPEPEQRAVLSEKAGGASIKAGVQLPVSSSSAVCPRTHPGDLGKPPTPATCQT